MYFGKSWVETNKELLKEFRSDMQRACTKMVTTEMKGRARLKSYVLR